ncbi:MAG TPA: hypothetical protein VK892_19990 [Pyrinomonadaceae bacterium]|nr:hypothetical protein [Pyrinomonadaceae bacterium]
MNEKAIEKLLNPPPNGKIAAAKEFGIDLTLLARKLRLTPEERLEELQQAMESFEELRREAEKSRQNDKTKVGNRSARPAQS